MTTQLQQAREKLRLKRRNIKQRTHKAVKAKKKIVNHDISHQNTKPNVKIYEHRHYQNEIKNLKQEITKYKILISKLQNSNVKLQTKLDKYTKQESNILLAVKQKVQGMINQFKTELSMQQIKKLNTIVTACRSFIK